MPSEYATNRAGRSPVGTLKGPAGKGPPTLANHVMQPRGTFYLYISIFNRSSDMLADLYPKQKRRNVAVTPFEISGAEGRT